MKARCARPAGRGSSRWRRAAGVHAPADPGSSTAASWLPRSATAPRPASASMRPAPPRGPRRSRPGRPGRRARRPPARARARGRRPAPRGWHGRRRGGRAAWDGPSARAGRSVDESGRAAPADHGAPLGLRRSGKLGDVTRQDLVELGEVGTAPERLLHVPERGRDGAQEVGVLLHAIDEDEPPCVLELPLDGEEVEEIAEGAVLEARPTGGRELCQVAPIIASTRSAGSST